MTSDEQNAEKINIGIKIFLTIIYNLDKNI